MYKKVISNWPILLLIISTLVLRIINLEQLFYFTYDEAIPAFVGRRLILWHHIPLIGGVTPFGVHLAPYFYWFYSVILFFGKLNPIAWGYTGALIATITTFLIFIIGKELGTKRLAITAAIMWTFSYLANLNDRHLWALYWAPLISLLTIYSLIKIIRGNHKFTLLLGITVALGVHADPSNLVFILLVIIVWIIYKIPLTKHALLAVVIILISFVPLAIFDLRHNFANTKPFFQFWQNGNNQPGLESQKLKDNSLLFPRVFTRLIYTFGDDEISKQYSYCKVYVNEKFNAIPWYFIFFSSIILIGFIRWSLKSKGKDFGWKLISLLVVLYFLGIQIYGTIFRADIFEHYITGIFPLFLLIFAKLISLLPRPIWLLALAIFVSTNLFKLLHAQNNLGLAKKREAIEFTMQQVGNRPFSLDSVSTCWKLSGYRYLFIPFGREPQKSYVDPNLSYLYGTTQVADKHPSTIVAFVTHDFMPETQEFYLRYALLKSHEVGGSLFGNIEVIIMDNSSRWFDQPITLKNPNIPVNIE